jgi:hypothetical protein
MKKILLGGTLAVALVALVVTVAPAHNDRHGSLHGTLEGFHEVPAISTSAHGDIKVKLRSDSIEFRLRYADLEAPVKFAHIHFAQEDVNGGVAAFLCGGGGKAACPQEGTVTGTIAASDVVGPVDQGIAAGELGELKRAIKHGKTYANVHSDKFPNGEIRGQIGGQDDDHGRGHDDDDHDSDDD